MPASHVNKKKLRRWSMSQEYAICRMLISYSARQIWPICDRGSPLGLSSALAESDSVGCGNIFMTDHRH
jgi:hypothetical protein